MKKTESDFERYSATLDQKDREVFERIRLLAQKNIKPCTERMSYGMPGFDSNGIIFWFAVWKTHYGIYPKANALNVLAAKLKDYVTSKGCLQIPKNTKLPVKLIEEIIRFRIKENEEALKLKSKKVAAKKSLKASQKKAVRTTKPKAASKKTK